MKLHKLTGLKSLAFAGLLATLPAVGATMTNLPPEKTQGGVSYMTGGIGTNQSSAMRLEESKFPLAIEFVEHAKPNAEYLANVDVKIVNDANKVVLDTVSDGPFLLAKLPPGKYTVTAMSEGKTKMQAVTLPADKHERVVMEW